MGSAEICRAENRLVSVTAREFCYHEGDNIVLNDRKKLTFAFHHTMRRKACEDSVSCLGPSELPLRVISMGRSHSQHRRGQD